jgi:hypothetical protein
VACLSALDTILLTVTTLPYLTLSPLRLPYRPSLSAESRKTACLPGPAVSTHEFPGTDKLLAVLSTRLVQREWGDPISVSLLGPVASLSPLHCPAGLTPSRSPLIQSHQEHCNSCLSPFSEDREESPPRRPNLPSCSSASIFFSVGANRRYQSWSPAQHRILVPGGDQQPNRASLRHVDPNFCCSDAAHCYSCSKAPSGALHRVLKHQRQRQSSALGKHEQHDVCRVGPQHSK